MKYRAFAGAPRISAGFLAFLAAISFGLPLLAQPVFVVDPFDPSGSGGNSYAGGQIGNVWGNWFGNAFQSLTWDSSSDASNNPASGSMKITANFNGQGGIPNQFVVYDGFNGITPPLKGLFFTNFQCDVRFAAGSAVINGTFGHLEFGIAVGSSQDYFGSVDVPSGNTNWVHVSITLNARTDSNLQSISDVLIHMYGPSMSGVSTFWVDNIKFAGQTQGPTNCVVNWNDVHQKIDGFGASSAWMSGSLSTANADLLFSTNTGAGLSLLRTRIAPDGTSWETSIAQQAQARGARIWSTPWSPPITYKNTNSVSGGSFVSSAANYQGYAAQLANYIASMKNTYGISLYAVSVQNEPGYSTDYESCLWTAQQIHDFVPYLSTALSNINAVATRIMLPEDANWKWDLAATTMNDTATSNLVGVLAAHSYGSTAAPVTQFGTPRAKTLWETEHYFGSDDSINNGVGLAEEIHSYMTVAEANAYHYWWLQGSGNGSVVGNSWSAPAKRLFVMGNYSRFVRPGYCRIGVSNNAATSISAYKDTNSGAFAIIAVNSTYTTVTQVFNLANFTTGSVTQWVTSGSLSLSQQGAIVVNGSSFTNRLPALSVVTFVGTAIPPNTAPTNITLSNTSIAENLPAGTVVGTMGTADADPGNTFTYRLVSGAGSGDNASFVITNNTLYAAVSFNYGATNSYNIRLRSTDQGGLYFEKVFTITVTYVNQAPTDISLSNGFVGENLSSGTVVGTLSATDPDMGDTFTYSLTNGAGGDGNSLFAITTNTLFTAAILDQQVQTNLSIRVRAMDQGGLWVEKSFSIAVTPDSLARRIVGIAPAADGNLAITFSGIAGYDYRVLAATNLASPTWEVLTNNLDGGTVFTAGTDGLWILTDLNSTNFSQRFYRSVEP